MKKESASAAGRCGKWLLPALAALTAAGWNEYLVLALTMVLNFVTEVLYQRLVVYRKRIDTNDVARRAEK